MILHEICSNCKKICSSIKRYVATTAQIRSETLNQKSRNWPRADYKKHLSSPLSYGIFKASSQII